MSAAECPVLCAAGVYCATIGKTLHGVGGKPRDLRFHLEDFPSNIRSDAVPAGVETALPWDTYCASESSS